MGMDLETPISEIIEQVNIADYIGQYVELFERGGELWGLSPFKDEKTPSFSIRPEQNVFWDFSSGKGGNVIDFIKYYNNCSVGRAIYILKEYAGKSGEPVTKRLPATSVIAKYKIHNKQLKQSTAKHFASNHMDMYERRVDKLAVWINEGISPDVMEKYQVRYDPIDNRIVFPLRSPSGDILNIQGRTLDPNFKEKGLRKYTYLYYMGTLDTIFGLYENTVSIMKQKEIILFEGAKSVMLAETWGITNTAAIQTSHLNPHQLRILIRLGVRVVFALDSEINIQEDENILKLKKYVRVEWVKNISGILEDKMSPVDLGKEQWEFLYERRVKMN
ncbi:MAG: CHC2 zinc finger domain-containing protein [Bacteroides sp.]